MAYWLIDRLIDWLIDWLTDWLIDWLTDGLIAWLIDWLTDWLIDWVSDRLIDWLIERLINWLIDWLIIKRDLLWRKVENIIPGTFGYARLKIFTFFHREQDARITALQSEKEYVPFVLFCFEILINNQILSSMQLTEHNDALEKNALRRKNRQFRNRIVLCWNVLNPIMFPNFCRPKHVYIFFVCCFPFNSERFYDEFFWTNCTFLQFVSCHQIMFIRFSAIRLNNILS